MLTYFAFIIFILALVISIFFFGSKPYPKEWEERENREFEERNKKTRIF